MAQSDGTATTQQVQQTIGENTPQLSLAERIGVLEAAIGNGVSVILTSDHGNCDEMVDTLTGEPHTQHSNHPVPCLIIDNEVTSLLEGGNLSAIAPTVLQLMGISQPPAMSGKSVIRDTLSE